MAGTIGLLVASPYWLSIIRNQGPGLFWNAFSAQQTPASNSLPFPSWLAPLFNFTASGALYPFVWDFIIFSGVLWAVFKRQWWLPIWFLALGNIPREGWWMASVPASILAGFGIGEFWQPFLTSTSKGLSWLERGLIYISLAIFIPAYLLLNVRGIITQELVRDYNRAQWSAAIEAMRWAKQNTPTDRRFLVLSAVQVREWAPQLMERTVLNVPQGAEWEPEKYQQIRAFEEQVNDCNDVTCFQGELESITDDPQITLFVEKSLLTDHPSAKRFNQVGFEVLWQNSGVVIGRFPSTVQP
jgi:hypothetical protein